MNGKNLVITILLVLLVGGGAFYAGMKYQQSKTTSQFRQFAQGRFGNNTQGIRNGNGGNGNFGERPVSGQILSVDNNSVTVKLADGSTKIVILSDKTSINQSTSATKDDLKDGTQVTVIGTNNSDGSVTAQDIQIGTFFRGLGGTPPAQNQ